MKNFVHAFFQILDKTIIAGDASEYAVYLFDLSNFCKEHIILGTETIESQNFSAINTIVSSNKIPSEISINFQAGNSITLKQGFHAMVGSDFHAIIGDCTNDVMQNINFPNSVILRNDEIYSKIISPFKIYPNPTTDIIYIERIEKINSDFKVELYDLMGRQVDYWNFSDEKESINVSGLKEGIYFLKLDSQWIEKIVINRK